MATDRLREILGAYRPTSPRERTDCARLETALNAEGGDVWSRSTPLHVTGSALVVHPPSGQVLLRWHATLQGWLQVGGHADPGERDPWEVAHREATEETGLRDLRPLPTVGRRPTQIVIVDVPARPATAHRPAEPAHEHADVRYLLETSDPERARPEDDTSPLWWGPVGQGRQRVGEANLGELIERAADAMGPRIS